MRLGNEGVGVRPGPDETLTWHEHQDGTWGWGALCPACVATPLPGPTNKIHFNIARLRADNAGHYTQRELAREITDAADRDGRDIEHPA